MAKRSKRPKNNGYGAKLTGDWSQVKRMFGGMPQAYKEAIREALPQVGLKCEQIAVKYIQSGELGWEPLNEDYLKAKIKRGESEKILVASSTYIQAITSRATNDAVFAGIFKKSVYKDKKGKAKVYNIARTLEYGSEKMNIPPRPLWEPTYKEVREWLKKEAFFAKKIAEKIRNIK